MLRKVRLVAAIVLVCAFVLPLSECSRRESHSPPRPKSISQRLFPQTNAEFSYQYAYGFVGFSAPGAVTVLAFIWPLVFVLSVRRRFGPKLQWFLRVLEVLLCAGTIYWLDVLTLRGFGARWLYGAYVGVIAVAIFALVGVALWFGRAKGVAERAT